MKKKYIKINVNEKKDFEIGNGREYLFGNFLNRKWNVIYEWDKKEIQNF